MIKRIQLLGTLFCILLLFSFVNVENSSDHPKMGGVVALEGYEYNNHCKVGTGLHADYFADARLGQRVLSTIDQTINFDLYQRAPKAQVPAHQFSVRWTGGLYAPETGIYTFTMRVDDGARIWIDNQLMLDEWDRHEPTAFTFKTQMKAGTIHHIRVEYVQYMFNEAVAQLQWSFNGSTNQIIPAQYLYPCPEATCFANPQLAKSFGNKCNREDAQELQGRPFDYTCRQGNGLSVEYFADSKLNKLVVRDIEPQINFFLYRKRPRAKVPADEFSARWTGGLYSPVSGIYDFYMTVDDGARVWIDDELLLDEWGLNAPTEFQFRAKMKAGQMHTIRVEYAQFMYNEAVAQLEWSFDGQTKTFVPMEYLYSKAITDCNEPLVVEKEVKPVKKNKVVKTSVIAVIIAGILTALQLKKNYPGEN